MYKVLIITMISGAIMACSTVDNSTVKKEDSEKLNPEIAFEKELFYGDWECSAENPDKDFMFTSKISNTVDNQYSDSTDLIIKRSNLNKLLYFKGTMSGKRQLKGDKIYSTVDKFDLIAKDDFSQMYYNRIKRPMIERLEREDYKFGGTLISLDSVSYSYSSEAGNIINCKKITKNND